jgi:hypothetical protein
MSDSQIKQQTESEKYISLLDLLSQTREVKNSIAVAMDSLLDAKASISEAEQVAVQLVLQGRKLVACSEKDRTDKQ